MAPLHRNLGAHLWKGMEPWQVMASFMGKATSPDRRPGRDAALRPAGPGRLQPAQPHPGQLPGGHRDGVRREVPRRGQGVPGVLRRRVDLAGGLPRVAVDRERAEAAERLRHREQPVRLLHAAAADVELGERSRSRRWPTASRG